MTFTDAMEHRRKGKVRKIRTRARASSMEAEMFAPRTRTSAVDDSPPQEFESALPAGTVALADNYAPRSVREAAMGKDQVTSYQLKTSGDGNAAVPSAAVQTGAFTPRWVGGGDNPHLAGIKIAKGQIMSENRFGANDIPDNVVYGNQSGQLHGNKLIFQGEADKLNYSDAIKNGPANWTRAEIEAIAKAAVKKHERQNKHGGGGGGGGGGN